jgi:integrase/recombinase XerC
VQTPWEEAIDAFFAECARKNLSASTIENYRWYLDKKRMKDFLADHDITSPVQFDAGMLRRFEGELFAVEATVPGAKGLSAGTVDTFHRVLKNFLNFCSGNGYADVDIKGIQKIKAPKKEDREAEFFTEKEIIVLRRFLKDRPRDLFMVNFMLATGLRLAEVCALTLDNVIDTPNGYLVKVVQGKGRKDRGVPLESPYVPRDNPKFTYSDMFDHYVRKVRPQSASRALFLTSRLDGGDYLPLSATAIQTLFKRMSEPPAAGGTGLHVNPHKFRHTFATLTAPHVSPLVLQKFLGHASVSMSAHYYHHRTDDLFAAYGLKATR